LPTLNAAPSAGPALTPDEFQRVRRVAMERAGLSIPESKSGLVSSRVAKRLREHQIGSFSAYLDLVESPRGADEMVQLIDLLTTNKTDFFREPAHFDFLIERVFPRIKATGAPLRIWSAGCSTGEEPYTLAMLIRENLPVQCDARILATDISTRVVAQARSGIYGAERTRGMEPERKRRWFAPAANGAVAVVPELQKLISFANLNLMADWPMKGPFDAIFCRNVMIYFDKPTITTLVDRCYDLLAPGGFLFIGHSESLTALQHRYSYVQPAVYAK
jgi:chemotaxis protein methyltransferase CheR